MNNYPPNPETHHPKSRLQKIVMLPCKKPILLVKRPQTVGVEVGNVFRDIQKLLGLYVILLTT